MSTPALQRGETYLQPVRLTLDVEHEQAAAQLRLAAAGLAAVAGVWLAWVESSLLLRLTALASVLFAARWVVVFRRARRRAHSGAAAHFLEITTQGATLTQGPHTRFIAHDQVARIELDEDRLVVVLRLVSGEEVAIEPVYGGLGLRELGETLQRYLSADAARPPAGMHTTQSVTTMGQNG